MLQTAVFVPSYGRAEGLRELAASLSESTEAPYRLYLILEVEDTESRRAAADLDASVILNPGPKTYASCVNSAYQLTDEPFFFTGADDIRFGPGWLEAALDAMSDPAIGVVGSMDPIHPWHDHSTHVLVRRSYIDEYSGCLDARDTVFHNYHHAYADWELLAVAKVRRAYTLCEDSIVEHRHPDWLADGRVDPDSVLFDSTYAKGNANHDLDRNEWIERSAMWASDFRRLEVLTPADKHMLRVMDGATFRGRARSKAWHWAYRLLPSALRRRATTFMARVRWMRYRDSPSE